MSYIAVGGMAISVVGSIFGASKASKKEKAAKKQAAALQRELNSLEANRQAIINPYATSKDVSSMATDLSGIMSNPYANLGVATAATEMQIQETDQALANTLDTLRETGASAGGATALAMAALKSKQGVTADIEQQEANNEKLKAQGQQQMEQVQLQQAQRVQDIQMSEAQRIQSTEAAGAQFMFQTREGREMQKMDRVAAQLGGAQQQQTQASADKMGAITGGIGAVSNIAGAVGGSYAKSTPSNVKSSLPNYSVNADGSPNL
jgi:hypothetical protein